MVALSSRHTRPLDLLAGGACCLLENRPRALPDSLTAAERRVLAYVCAGYANKEIAWELGRAEPMIKHQVSSCLRKFGVPSRSRLIAVLR